MSNIFVKNSSVVFLLLLGAFLTSLNAQESDRTIYGKVLDKFGNGLKGVLVQDDKQKNITLTSDEGTYSLNIDEETEYLKFSLAGYLTQKVLIENEEINLVLDYDNHDLDEMVKKGYVQYPRKMETGATSRISGEELSRSPVANMNQALSGRLPGLFSEEVYSEPANEITELFVRGFPSGRKAQPLIVIDGIINSYNANETLNLITPEEIESVTVLKDAASQAIYGIQGGNGVIVVETKRGHQGPLKINARADQSFQFVTTAPDVYNAADYASYRNQAAYNDGLGENYFYSEEEIDNYRDGTNALYPDNNWYDEVMKDYSQMQRVNLNASGGNKRVKFFSNLNMMHQGNQFKTDQDEYNPNVNNIWVNFRSNIDVNLNKRLKSYVRINGNLKRRRTPGMGSESVYSGLFNIPSNVYGPVTPEIRDKETDEIIVPEGEVITSNVVDNPFYGILNRSGYTRSTSVNINSQLGFEFDMDFITKGLSVESTFAYQTYSIGDLHTTQNFERWIRDYGVEDELMFVKKGTDENTPLQYSKGSAFTYHLTSRNQLKYDRVFKKHSVSAMGYFFYQDLTTADTQSPLSLPYRRVSTGGHVHYGFDDRYIVQFDLGYSGSEQYDEQNRFISTPSISGAWVVSNESFLQENDWLSNFKLRYSYGKTGNDRNNLPRYSYLDNISIDNGGFLDYLLYHVNEDQFGNHNLQAEISTKQNIGVDIGLFNSLSFSLDIYEERMDNMIVDAVNNIPSFQGVPLNNYPASNLGVFENQGYEVELDYKRNISEDFGFFISGQYSYNENLIKSSGEAPLGENYAYPKRKEGFPVGQQFGLIVDYSNGNGFFNSQEELDNYLEETQYDFGDPRVGDLIYEDVNEDGVIDERDNVPLGKGTLPRSFYGISGGVSYKSFNLNVLFQGTGDWSSIYNGIGTYETFYEGVYGSIHRNAWTEERFSNNEEISYPALSLSESVNHEPSDFFLYDRSYLRLKNIEFSYELPSNILNAVSAKNIRLIFSGQNLFTWDNMKTDDFGPEGVYSSFPVYKVYNVGISLSF